MFKKFDPAEAVSSRSQVKSGVVRGIRAALVEQYPLIEGVIDEILPKKDISMAKCQNHVNILCAAQEPFSSSSATARGTSVAVSSQEEVVLRHEHVGRPTPARSVLY